MSPEFSPKRNDRKNFQRRILSWYELHRRELPWRISRDPYRVWLSEIMLQQTRVAAGIPHYHELLPRFPTREHLGAVRAATQLAGWSRLRHYPEARQLAAAPQSIVRENCGTISPSRHG